VYAQVENGVIFPEAVACPVTDMHIPVEDAHLFNS
jgi:hypothetical protein